MKIYHLLAQQKRLYLQNGDRINELKLLTALCQFAEVHYNAQKFDPEAEDYGLVDKDIKLPEEEYDLYYVRNNPEIFKALPSPKVCIAYPYSEEIFREADAVVTTTQIWKERLEAYNKNADSFQFFNSYYPEEIVLPKKVINIGQVLDPYFYHRRGTFKHFRYRAKFGYGFAVGYFGRVDDEALPHPDFFQIHDELLKEIPNLCPVFGGKIKKDMPNNAVRLAGLMTYEDMPYVVSACDVVLCNEHSEADWLGSGKTLEAMACGVPMALTPRPARLEQLGSDYPCYYKTAEELKALLVKLHTDKIFYKSVQDYLLERAKYFHIDRHAQRLEKIFKEVAK